MKKPLALMLAVLMLTVGLAACAQTPAASTPDESTAATTTTSSEADATDPTNGDTTSVTDPSGSVTDPTDPTATDPSKTEDVHKPTTDTPTQKPTTTKTTTSSTKPVTTSDWKKNYRSKQIINDNTFQNGFKIACNKTPGQSCGTWNHLNSTKQPSWQLAQWSTFKQYDCDHSDTSNLLCLWENRQNSASNVLTNGFNRVEYVAARKSMILSMNTFDYYHGLGHTNNSDWPHLLLEQGIISRNDFYNLDDRDQLHYSLAADKMILEMDLRITKFEHEVHDGINAFQIVSFYYVVSQRDSGFIWFSVPIFDDRGYDRDYVHKEDPKTRFTMDWGTGNYMYGLSFKDVYDSTLPTGRYDFFNPDFTAVEPSESWMHVQIDLTPYLGELAEYTLKGTKYPDYNIYKSTSDKKDLYLGGLNLGFEVHGSYNVDFEIANYSLTSYVKK